MQFSRPPLALPFSGELTSQTTRSRGVLATRNETPKEYITRSRLAQRCFLRGTFFLLRVKGKVRSGGWKRSETSEARSHTWRDDRENRWNLEKGASSYCAKGLREFHTDRERNERGRQLRTNAKYHLPRRTRCPLTVFEIYKGDRETI